MKCLSCDSILSDREATRKYAGTNEYLDLCNHCIKDSCLTDQFTVNNNLSDDNEEFDSD